MITKRRSTANGLSVSLAEWEYASILLKSHTRKSIAMRITDQPSHEHGTHPHPYVFALNQSFVLMLILSVVHSSIVIGLGCSN